MLDTPTDDLSKDKVMEIYGRVATTTGELAAIEQELAEVREQLLSEELRKSSHEHENEPGTDSEKS